MTNIDFDKMDGLVPAIIQDATTRKVLMLGFMNNEAYEKTINTGKVTFWSRSRQCLWTKGETSGNFLELVSMQLDCDCDTLLVKANPLGPTCHKGTDTCWGEDNIADPIFSPSCKILLQTGLSRCLKGAIPQAFSRKA